jgi:protein-S-isoprenylcysteine O-methyltransferase Ste14
VAGNGNCGIYPADKPGSSRDRGDVQARPNSAVRRAYSGRTYSACAYAAFLAASLWGVLFLADRGPTLTVDSTRSGPAWLAVPIDLGLWLVFGLQHSVLARAEVKQWLTRVVPGRMERSTYVLSTSLALGLLFWQWRALPATIWRIHAQPGPAFVWVIYGAGWAIAVAATFMTDHWDFLGLRQAGWVASQPQSPASVSRRWLYSWVRHPMMVGLLLAFWATPSMTAGHLLFALAASGYIAVGIHFEERDLRRNLGTDYDDYAEQVPRFVPGLTPSPPRCMTAAHRSAESADR